MENKSKIKNDIILIAAVLLIAAIALVCLILFRKSDDVEDNTAVVYVDKQIYGTYKLTDDTQVEIVSERGRNLLVISGGKATVTEASCPDLICVHHKAISAEGEQIVCLPNKIVVSIE